ncbi:MAG: UvrD-helicase domain-containing protein [Fibrobacter sp.]|nr:UvrD-helicase domain-containing protein [Fibrobacter sp.]
MIENFQNLPVINRMILNKVQREAVEYCNGPQLVFAGAGTGKTRVLTAKIAFLIEKGINPWQILAATFTNKSAGEMRQRVENLVNVSVDGLWIGTFHSLCARILRRECLNIDYTPSFTIYDRSDQISLLKKVLKNLEIDDRSMPPKQIHNAISKYKNLCLLPEDLQNSVKGYYEQEVLRVYKSYQEMLHKQQAMDFDDLLMQTVLIFRKNENVLLKYRNMFKYVLVDEYQDTNYTQFLFLKMLVGNNNKIFVVGDDDQSIYGWRGAQIENILSFERQYPDTKVFKLEQNYRSTKHILDFANAAIMDNKIRASKKLWTDRTSGEKVILTRYRDNRQEAESIAKKICSINDTKTMLGEIAILFRTNAQSRSFEEAFRKHRIPYVLVGGTGFYERAEVKDCIAYLRLIINPCDDESFGRIMNVPARGLGDKARDTLIQSSRKLNCSMLEALMRSDISALGSRYQKGFSDLKSLFEILIEMEKSGESPDEILKQLLHFSGYMDMLTSLNTEEASARIENINELINALTIWSSEGQNRKLSSFLEEISLVSDVDCWEKKENSVNLMTLHCAKGLEFKHIFLVGLEDGIIPSRQNFDDDSAIEEERRLFYVGLTRAMENLECSYVDYRWRFGDLLPSTQSRFLNTIPSELYNYIDSSIFIENGSNGFKPRFETETREKPQKKRKVFNDPGFDDFSQDTIEFRMGQHVKHKTYGRGRILSISGFGDDMKLTVLFNNGSRKKLMAKFANFESV